MKCIIFLLSIISSLNMNSQNTKPTDPLAHTGVSTIVGTTLCD